ncbi:MAG: FHA domain-containing protein, partial [Acidobacteriota bacterium]
MTDAQKPHYRLSGLFDGRSLCFDLPEGEHSVGSAPDNSIRLPMVGVSRQHAALDVSSAGLRVHDLGSKNGTFIDGARVQRAAAGDGARLAFGPVELSASSIEPGAALAIRFEPPSPEASSWADLPPSETILVETLAASVPSGAEPRTGEAGAMDLVDVLGATLADGTVGAALQMLVEHLGARGACVVEWSPAGEPLAVDSGGDPGEVPTLDQLRRRLGAEEPVGGWCAGAWRSERAPESV